MVTLLTDYNTQRYILNSTDDIDDIEFHNGDQLLLMDQDALIIFDEENAAWHSVPTGGGGGGGEAHPYIQKFTYTQAESWLSDTYGNVKNFAETYFTGGNGLYWGSIDQAYSATYGARRFCVCRSAGDTAAQHASEWQRKSGNWSQNYSASASWYIEAGATITVYFILYTDVPEV